MVTEAAAISPPVRSRRPSLNAIGVALLLVVAIGLPFLVSGYRVLEMTHIVCFAIALLGLNLLTGYSGQISLGNGAFSALGGYTAVILVQRFGVPYWITPLPVAVICYTVGYLFGRSATRLEGLYLALATFSLAVVMPALLKLDAIAPWTGGATGQSIRQVESPIRNILSDDLWMYFYCLAIAIVLFVAAWNLVRGRTGRALVALRDHPIAASTMGINTVAYKSTTFGLSAMYTGIAGGLAAIVAAFASPESYSVVLSIQLLVGSVLGGIASIFGTLFGAAFIELIPDTAKSLFDAAPDVLYGILLILCMLVMPGGFTGLIRSARLWFERRLSRARI